MTAIVGQDAPPRPAAALADAVRTLTTEARDVAAGRRPARTKADFAKSFQHPVPPDALGRKIITPVAKDPFVDAYVRWQLTSFKPALPPLDRRGFDRMMRQLPPLAENPRARTPLLERLAAAVRAGALDETQQTRFRTVMDQLAKESTEAAGRNRPAIGLRRWLTRQFPDTGERAILLRVESCAALALRGWPVERAKAYVDKVCRATGATLVTDEAQRVTRAIDRLAGPGRSFLRSARLTDGGEVRVQYGDASVYDFETRGWVRSLR
jgi:hypothetical protein